MVTETHFIQRCEGPVFTGPGSGTLCCACGRELIAGYDPARFRGVGIECGGCGAVTTTPGLPEGEAPPRAVIVAEPVGEPRMQTTPLPANVFVIGRAEIDRITALYQPANPARNVYAASAALLDEVQAAYERVAGGALPAVGVDLAQPFDGITQHALGWAVAHLRRRIGEGAWAVTDRADTSAAATICAAFLHFVATWAHHPLFPAMAATVGEAGCSLHGLAPFAAAHCLSMQGNRISFPQPEGFPGRIVGFDLATGPVEAVQVRTVVFAGFEHPHGRPWDHEVLRAAAADVIMAEQGRINLRNPGLLLLSPGIALSGFDEALIRAVQHAMLGLGRKNRGLMAVAPIVLRMMPEADPHAIRFGYGLFPVFNRHYQGETLVQAGGG
jgi:hypothetical protein